MEERSQRLAKFINWPSFLCWRPSAGGICEINRRHCMLIIAENIHTSYVLLNLVFMFQNPCRKRHCPTSFCNSTELSIKCSAQMSCALVCVIEKCRQLRQAQILITEITCVHTIYRYLL